MPQGLQKCNFSTFSTIFGTGFGDQKYAKTPYLYAFQRKFIFLMADLGEPGFTAKNGGGFVLGTCLTPYYSFIIPIGPSIF
jgi:hypothetical protein